MSLRPNIVYIMADDMGYGDPGCYNAESKIPTPNMDRLAREGVRFSDAHSSSSVCTPSRYSVLTGGYCWRTRLKSGVIGGFDLPLIKKGQPTVASLLKETGYTTAAIGKWHVGLQWQTKQGHEKDLNTEEWRDEGFVDYTKPILDGPLQHGFDYFFGIAGSLDMPPYSFIENDRTAGIPDIPKKKPGVQQASGFQTEDWEDELVDVRFAEKARGFIEENAARSDPFFLYLTPAAPHRPCLPPAFAVGKSGAGNRGDMVWVFDWVVGQVLDKLDACECSENTIVIVTSDNGANPCDDDGEFWNHKSCGDLRGYKTHIWEGGHRVPYIVRWPGHVKPGTVENSTIGIFDTIATVSELAGSEDTVDDAVSFLPCLSDGTTRRNCIVHHSGAGMFAYRRGKWKYIDGLSDGGWGRSFIYGKGKPVPRGPKAQLYDLEQDMRERRNLWLDKPEKADELKALLENTRKET